LWLDTKRAAQPLGWAAFLEGVEMNSKEIRRALKLLGDRVERSAVYANSGTGKQSLSVEWINGGSKVFRSLHEVQQYIEHQVLVQS